ncbi:AAA family ATPase [Curvibacter sp. APW13]|uniref:AAA family ATPase n=1 Tax=Curvibacter sp. APW13 TaxID=3077236 RepID=UPI0028E0356C|nr:AAA family ATPase [Curvibacter sp. APW13]MDT8990235.1 AAA family ATPase [Curvibacter sp. APW13]
MVRRLVSVPLDGHWIPTPGLQEAPVLELMCSRFVLLLAVGPGVAFNLRRDIMGLVAVVGRHLVWPQAPLGRLRSFLASRCRNNDLWRGQQELDDTEFLVRFGQWKGSYDESTLFYFLDDFAKDHAKELMAVLSCTAQWLERALKKQSTLVEKNINALAGVLQLNKAERALLLYGTLARYQRDMRSVLVEFKVSSAQQAYQALAEVAGVSAQELGEAMRAGSRLERTGLLENLILEHNITDLADLMKVSEKLPPVLLREYQDPADLMAVFTRRAVRSALSPDHFSFVEQDVQALQSLLRHAVQRKAVGVNVLIYGPPGTGKTELARVLAQSCGMDLYEVEYADRDGNALSGRDRYRSLQIAQVFLRSSANAVLLFDEVEDVFPRPVTVLHGVGDGRTAGGTSVSGKAWVNQVLEANVVPTLWVTNHIDHIDPAYRRRFAYHLELRTPPPKSRQRLVESAVGTLPVSKAYCEQLVQRKALTVAHIQTAARFAQLAAGADASGEAIEALMERQLANAAVALGQELGAGPMGAEAIAYDLDMLHLESRYSMPQLLGALRVRPHASLCFHGPPGSGKSALARHLAQQLGRSLTVRRASDLLGKYVGETEQALAAMFREAQAQGAILLLDEADSFLLDRRGARHQFEVTEVNELLQCMEQFAGTFICTTNQVERLDAAALRRFQFKIGFLSLTPTQRRHLFVRDACQGDEAALSDAMAQRLAALDQLCLGDFAAVSAQAQVLGLAWTPLEYLEQLEAEHRVKPEVREHRSVGFLPH